MSPTESALGWDEPLSHSGEVREFAGGFLKLSGTGIDHLTLARTDLSESEFMSYFPKGRVPAELLDGQAWRHTLPNGDGLTMEKTEGVCYYSRNQIQAIHRM